MNPDDCPQGYPIPEAYDYAADYWRAVEAFLQSQETGQEERQCQH